MPKERKSENKGGGENGDKADKAKKQPNRKNNKAFNVSHAVSAKRNMQRNLDKAQQKEKVPLRNATEMASMPPPDLIVVMGPKGCGKSTLIRSLVKLYTGQNLVDILGPITVVAGDRKRYTFFECPMDLYSMADLAKVADLVIVMIDASYGFEMETFEFINLLQLHGMPKVMGVMTHLDAFRSIKTLQNTKKAIKHRFWTEIFKGAKLYDMMGTINRKYRKHEVKRLSLAISRIKYRPLVWRNTHPYVLVDRVEESHGTSPTDIQEGLRDITLFGFVRGTHLKPSMKVHLIGAGDFDIAESTVLPDPVPTAKQQQLVNNNANTHMRKRKEALLYAPMANVGRVVLDGDDVYIDLHRVNYSQKESLYLPDQQNTSNMNESHAADGPMALVRSLQEVQKGQGIDAQLQNRAAATMKLFADDNSDVEHEKEDEFEDNDDEDEDPSDDEENEDQEDSDNDEDDEEQDFEDENDRWDDEEEEQENENEENDSDSDNDNNESDYDYEEEEVEDIDDVDKAKRLQSHFESKLGDFSHRQQQNLQKDIMSVIYGAKFDTTQQSTKDEDARNEHDDDDEDFFSPVSKNNSKKYTSNNTNNAVISNANFVLGEVDDNDAIDSSRIVRHSVVQLQHSSFLQAKFSSFENNNVANKNNYIPMSSALKHSSVVSEKKGLSGENYVRGGLFYQAFKTRFAAGKKQSTTDNEDGNEDEENDEFGELIDLENIDNNTDLKKPLKTLSSSAKNKKATVNDSDEEDHDTDEDDSEFENDQIDAKLRQMHAEKKALFSQNLKENDADNTDFSDRKSKKNGKVDEEDEDEKNLILEAQNRFLQQSERNAAEFGKEGDLVRVQYEGFRQGLYVKLKLRKVPVEFLRHFNARHPVVLGGLLPSETQMGYITARVKKHRWFRRVLKAQDPLVFSVGWRRYQSLPLYTTSDANDRQRHLKYTHENMHCTATFYGPLVAPNTGILAFPNADRGTANFRIALTGTALEQVATPNIVKKLKLVGTPTKIYKNTAFVTGMFSSALEVAKFEGAKLKTVSGIRGAIKKAVLESNMLNKTGGKNGVKGGFAPGTFRATFEDKILLSDLVVCRLWVNVLPKKFYNPVLSLLDDDTAYVKKPLAVTNNTEKEGDGDEKARHEEDMAEDEEDENEEEEEEPESEEDEDAGDETTENSATKLKLMRTTAQLRRDHKIAQQTQKDSVYKPIVRQERVFNKLKIPTKLQEQLPFKTRVRTQYTKKNAASYQERRKVGVSVTEPEERRARALLAAVHTIAKDKKQKREKAETEKRAKKQKDKQRESERFAEIHKDEKRKRYRESGLEEERRRKKAENGGSNKRRKLSH